jgi:uncharacterized protein
MHEQSPSMKAFFFGDPERRLFGIHHPARASARRDAAVVLCYPGPQEYSRSHWAFRKLATLLSSDGFDVLRFDYFGTGDSSGDPAEADVATSVMDIEIASRELLDTTELSRLSLVGMRLGAALALRATMTVAEVRQVVLWDPVVRGRDYLRELEAQHESQALLRLQPLPHAEPPWNELLGFPCTPRFLRDMDSLDLTTQPARPGTVDLVWTGADPAAQHSAVLQAWAAREKIPLRSRAQAAEFGGERAVQDGVLMVDKALGAIVEALAAGPQMA